MEQIIRSTMRQWMPAPWLAALQYYYLKPSISEAFNDQRFRQRIFLALLQAVPFQAIIETGTFRASTTVFMAEKAQIPVYTVEAQPRFFHYAKLRLRPHKQVHMSQGDSRQFLRQLAQDASVPKQNVFFYLDAHWYMDLPLRDELELISSYWQGSVIMIDDFEVPGDDGYEFDDYGEGKRLCLDHISPLSRLDMVAFFPSVSSQQETGRRRGCVVLANSSVVEKVSGVETLRLHQLNQ